ncbi:MAG: DUF302 domain-containing protein [Pseudomonadota bacterium]
MKKSLAAIGVIAATSLSAQADIVRVQSPHSVDETIDRLAAAIEGAGAKVFARVDHAKGAASVDMELAPATALIFGNPKLGTPAMLVSPEAGLDLPLRALAYEKDGTVWLIYHDPADLAAKHGIPADHPIIAAMTGALGKLTGVAVAE